MRVSSQIDKHFTEISVLRKEFPKQRILLCQYHAISWIKKKVHDPKMKLSDPTLKTDMVTAFQALVYARSEVEYVDTMKMIEHKLRAPNDEGLRVGGDKHPYFVYLIDNWHNCIEMWSKFARGNCEHLNTNTTNHLESAWGHTKPELCPRMDLDDTMKVLLVSEDIRATEAENKDSRVGWRNQSTYTRDMKYFLNQVTGYAASLVNPQYTWAMDVSWAGVVSCLVSRMVFNIVLCSL